MLDLILIEKDRVIGPVLDEDASSRKVLARSVELRAEAECLGALVLLVGQVEEAWESCDQTWKALEALEVDEDQVEELASELGACHAVAEEVDHMVGVHHEVDDCPEQINGHVRLKFALH